MSKLLGFLLLAIGAVVLVPSLRERAMPHVAPALDPFYSWSARNRVTEIVDLLHQEETLGRPIPAPREFAQFVDRRDVKKGASLDPWGTPFYLQVNRRTYVVGSAGKDRRPRTPDDIVSPPQPRKDATRR
jgi:hypothetical protein